MSRTEEVLTSGKRMPIGGPGTAGGKSEESTYVTPSLHDSHHAEQEEPSSCIYMCCKHSPKSLVGRVKHNKKQPSCKAI